MSKKEKLLQKIKNNPKSIRFEEIDKLLIDIGCEKRQPRGGSSHYTYTIEGITLTIPYKRPYVKEIYVREAIALLDRLENH